jgi:hypothetical protein
MADVPCCSEVMELDDLEDLDKTLHIKGQMIFISEWQQMLFLACPIMKVTHSPTYKVKML